MNHVYLFENNKNTPIVDNNNPKNVCNVSFSFNMTIPRINTKTTPPILSTGITVDTPGPVESALKEKVVKMDMSIPPIIAYMISRG